MQVTEIPMYLPLFLPPLNVFYTFLESVAGGGIVFYKYRKLFWSQNSQMPISLKKIKSLYLGFARLSITHFFALFYLLFTRKKSKPKHQFQGSFYYQEKKKD